ncbi:MAG: glycosyltransferase family 2 protein [Candidatus Thorarchaeota archaeon]|nr:glycosyltransferase family 2 protein [Candidatus Thorarchaeota archaeon]
MAKILAVTEYYNEAKNIPGLVENMAAQSYPPDLWLIIDDGSTDNSTELFEKNLKKFDIPYILYTMAPKPKPDQNLKGRAYRKIEILNNEWVDSDRFDFVILTGGDSRFTKFYTEIGVRVLQEFPEIGAMAGRCRSEPGTDTPMGGGKIVRWDIVRNTKGRYWDLDPDSLWNIIALSMGYKLLILKDLLMWTTRPTHMYASSGFYNYGARMFYVGWNPIQSTIYTLILTIRRTHPHHFLRGYLHKYVEGTWTCKDEEIKRFYSFKRMILRILGAVPMQDKATIVYIGADGISDKDLTDEYMKNVYSIVRKGFNQK